MNTDTIILAPESIRAALMACQEESLVDATMLHYEAAIDALEHPQVVEKSVKPVQPKPDCRCKRCGALLIKELSVTIHAPLNVTSFTKSQLRQPGVEVEGIHWSKQVLLCKACGWTNKSWLRKLL